MTTNRLRDDDDRADTEYAINVKPRRVEGDVRWHVKVVAIRDQSKSDVLVERDVPFLYPNAIETIRKAIDSEGRPRFA